MRISEQERLRLKDMAYHKKLSYSMISIETGLHKNTVANFLTTGNVLTENRRKITSCIENYEPKKEVA